MHYCSKPGQEGNYLTRQEAIRDCNINPRCNGVYDQGCDDTDIFTLCIGIGNIYPKDRKIYGDCIYKKIMGKLSLLYKSTSINNSNICT